MTQHKDSAKDSPAISASLSRPELRRALLQQRQACDLAQRQAWDVHIMRQIESLIPRLNCRHLAIYWPIKGEPALMDCYQKLHHQGFQLALPVVIGRSQALRFVAWAPQDEMELDDYGIPIPKNREHAVSVDTLLIPCVGFSNMGYRLGYGGGYYDRTLAQMPTATAIGIAYQQALVDFKPEDYDMPLTHIITETGYYNQGRFFSA